MKLIEAADATSIITTVIGYFTQNWPALAILIGFGVGLKLFRSFGNRGLKGRFQQFAGCTTPTTRISRILLKLNYEDYRDCTINNSDFIC